MKTKSTNYEYLKLRFHCKSRPLSIRAHVVEQRSLAMGYVILTPSPEVAKSKGTNLGFYAIRSLSILDISRIDSVSREISLMVSILAVV